MAVAHPLIRRPGTRRLSTILSTVFLYALLLAIAVTMMLPFVWMISTSLKPEGDIFIFPPQWIPAQPQWSNYQQVFQMFPFGLFAYNSVKIAVLGTLGQVITCSFAAYAFARFEFRGRGLLFILLLATLMVPGQVTLIPVFILMKTIGLVNTQWALITPWWFGGAFGTFLLRQFFLTLPSELEDAARMDGCGRFGIYWRIIIPLSAPALATLAIFVFLSNWNDLLGPVIYLSNMDRMTLTVGLALFQGQYQTQWNLLMAGSLISMIPIFVLFVVAQRYFVQGIALGSIKG